MTRPDHSALVVLPLQFSTLISVVKKLGQDMIITNFSMSHDLKVQVTQLYTIIGIFNYCQCM